MSKALTFVRCFASGTEIIVLDSSAQAPSRVSVEAEPTPFRNARLVLMLLCCGNRTQIEDVGSVQIAIDPSATPIIGVVGPLLER